VSFPSKAQAQASKPPVADELCTSGWLNKKDAAPWKGHASLSQLQHCRLGLLPLGFGPVMDFSPAIGCDTRVIFSDQRTIYCTDIIRRNLVLTVKSH